MGSIELRRNSEVLNGYQKSNVDLTGDPMYFGYLTIKGRWYIKRVSEEDGTYLYTKGERDYITNWSNRANLSYDYLDVVF